jgi:hypothetical protein
MGQQQEEAATAFVYCQMQPPPPPLHQEKIAQCAASTAQQSCRSALASGSLSYQQLLPPQLSIHAALM